MFKKAFALVFAFSTLAFANPAVYGKWAATQQDSGFTFTMGMNFSANQTSMTVHCAYAGKTATASVTVPSEITATQIHIKGSAEDRQSNGGLECTASAVPMSFDYQLQGNQLILSAQGQTLAFTRVQ